MTYIVTKVIRVKVDASIGLEAKYDQRFYPSKLLSIQQRMRSKSAGYLDFFIANGVRLVMGGSLRIRKWP